ncbi:UDP-N-acetylmuramate--L-alanine ligase-like isoform X1 [Phoenix dactylifera]|uniref:UDP-N-acetylmuramate--L-alanine ligase n=1 Tax=Phoenix dactylifera TaxID=42345 RepID=A0A8B8ZBN3_PHODC|nr:UDP-N-acetylmuramate--L-alanine ligase-like isoform X1 [Phoenix dactylifera]
MESRALLAAANGRSPAVPTRAKLGPAAPILCTGFSCRRRGRGVPLRARGSASRGQCAPLAAKGADTNGEDLMVLNGEEEGKKKNKGWIHFVGIGGSGLSALALLALKQGFEVSGSDIMWGRFMDGLHKAGARLFIGHSASNMERSAGSGLPNVVVVSSAIPADNKEIVHAKLMGIPIYKRDDWLRKITEKHKVIAISGTHGKSTTAAMLSYVLGAMGDDLIAVVGANVPQFSGGNIISGSGPNFVLEADEYDSCFLGLSPYIAVVTNVEWDHVDIFEDEEAVQNIFRRFVRQIKTGGHLILCGDSAGAYALLSESRQATVSCNVISTSTILNHGYSITTYGLSSKNDWHASSITPNSQGGQDYVLYYKACRIANISLILPGVHNVLNSLAVFATVATLVNDRHCVHETINSVGNHLSKFEGVSRRFELIGKVNGCQIYDDYAHHPTAVHAVLEAARQKFPLEPLWVVFQPHTFSRLAALMKDFATAFSAADYVIVTETYAAREINNWNSSGSHLVTLIRGPSTEYIPQLEDVIDKLVRKIPSNTYQDTIILTLGAGDIATLGPELLRRLQKDHEISNSGGLVESYC